MAKLELVTGTTSKLLRVFIQNNSVTTGAGLTGLVYNTSGLTAYYIREGASSTTAISLATATLGTWSTGGFIVVDGTNMPGVYELGIPNAALASGAASVIVYLQGAANMAPVVLEIELTSVNNQSTGFGLVDVSANVVQIAGSAVSATTAQFGVNVVNWNNTVVATPATAGIPDINVKNMNNVAATSITAISANQGTTQPINFSGTGSSAYVKSDTEQLNAQTVSASGTVTFPNATLASTTNITAGTITTATNVTNQVTANVTDINSVSCSSVTTVAAVIGTTVAPLFDSNTCIKADLVDIAGSAVSTSTAQLGVNVVNIAGTASAGAAGYVGVDWAHVDNPTSTVGLTGTTISTSQAIASVSGAVGSVTGAVGSVTATVTANTTEFAGQTITASSGVTIPSSIASPTNITGGTITTVTNLTNAPTSGDLTSTMKSSVTTAVNAATTVGITSNRKKAATATFEFPGLSATTYAPTAGLSFTMTISKDGGTAVATTNAVTDIGSGQYQIVLTATEMTANNIFLQATATGAVTYLQSLQSQP